jgi:hypothetical protein
MGRGSKERVKLPERERRNSQIEMGETVRKKIVTIRKKRAKQLKRKVRKQ